LAIYCLQEEGLLTAPATVQRWTVYRIDNKRAIYDILQMGKIVVTITPRFILLPKKSVTAISGIYE